MICRSRGLLQDGIGGDHLARNQVLADAEVLERPLGLSAPQLVRRHLDYTEAIGFLSHGGHVAILPSIPTCSPDIAGLPSAGTPFGVGDAPSSCGVREDRAFDRGAAPKELSLERSLAGAAVVLSSGNHAAAFR